MSRRCPVPGCKRSKREWALTCPECWRKAPAELRENMMTAPPRSAERLAAARDVLRWLAGGQRALDL